MLSVPGLTFDTAGNISTIAGNGQCAFLGDGGPAISAAIGNASETVWMAIQ